MKLAVLMGGRSSEREISLRTGRGIAQALRNLGHEATSVDGADGRVLPAGNEEQGAPSAQAVRALPLSAMLDAISTPAVREADVVFIALHGTWGEDGTVQAALELAGKIYTGSGVMASAVAMNKAMSKRVFEREAIPTPRWILAGAGEPLRGFDATLLGGYPLVVKPNEEGSTVGLTIARSPADLPGALRTAAVYGPEILIEEYIQGREVTVSVLGDRALPVVEIRPKSGFYDYRSKYTAGMSEYFCPADLEGELEAHLRELGLEAALALGCRGVSRADFRLSDEDEPYCLEVNTIPGMTPTSLVPMAARAEGMSYDQLVARMLELSLADARRRRAPAPARA
jgi:D-alanine-D-alanine ligase